MTESKPPTTRGSFTVKDEAQQQKYYGSIPHMVWYLGLHPLHITVYAYLVRVAGKHGVCWQSTKTIAAATRISAGKISEARKVLETAGLIKITKPGAAGRGHSYEIVIPNLWAINIGYIDKDPKCVAQVEAMAEKVHAMKFYKKTSPHEPKTSPHEPKKNTEEKHLKEREVKEDAPNTSPTPSRSSKGPSRLRGETEKPKRVLAGTGDSQRDHVDAAAAGPGAVQAKELVARAMYQVVTPDLEYPAGKTKRAKEARRSAEIAAGRVLERIGRENHQDALDACHLLLTEPTDREAKWLDNVSSIYGIVDTVTKRVSQLRGAARSRAEAVERNKRIQYEIGVDPGLGSEAVVVPLDAQTLAAFPDLPPEYVKIWRETKADLELQLARATYDTWLRSAVLQDVTKDGALVVSVNSQFAAEWLQGRLSPVIERTLEWIAGRPVEISFVARNGVENGNQDED